MTNEEQIKRMKLAEYVETPEGPTCGNCEYVKAGICIHPPKELPEGGTVEFDFPVDLVKGCCRFWEANDDVKPNTLDFVHHLNVLKLIVIQTVREWLKGRDDEP